MQAQTCCFTGHRNIPFAERASLQARLEQEILKLTGRGVIYYGAGGAPGFDTLAAQTVLRLRRSFPQIRLILVLPCENQTRGWREEDVLVYQRILFAADKVVYMAKQYEAGCMHRRNRHLAEHSAYCICYLNRQSGGTYYTVQYALSQGCTVINCAQTPGI